MVGRSLIILQLIIQQDTFPRRQKRPFIPPTQHLDILCTMVFLVMALVSPAACGTGHNKHARYPGAVNGL